MKIFPFAPDWGTQPQLTWVWRTAVTPALDQTETRLSLSTRSLLKFNFDVGAFSQDEAERLQIWLNSVDASEMVLLPLWVDRVFLDGEADAGTVEIATESTQDHFFADKEDNPLLLMTGDLFLLNTGDTLELNTPGANVWIVTRPNLILWKDYNHFEAIGVTEVDANEIASAAAIVNSYSIGDSAITALAGYIHLAQKGTLKTDELLRVSIKFEEAPPASTWAVQVPPPVVTSGALVVPPGSVFGPYQIVATNAPTLYTATGLPAGLVLDPATGIISGTIIDDGATTYDVTIEATNGAGTGIGTLSIKVGATLIANFHVYDSIGLATLEVSFDFADFVAVTPDTNFVFYNSLSFRLVSNTGDIESFSIDVWCSITANTVVTVEPGSNLTASGTISAGTGIISGQGPGGGGTVPDTGVGAPGFSIESDVSGSLTSSVAVLQLRAITASLNVTDPVNMELDLFFAS